MNDQDIEKIREVIQEEIFRFFSEFYDAPRRPRRGHLNEGQRFEEEISRLAFLNDKLAASLTAAALMKSCKYDKKTVDEIKNDTTVIKNK